MREPWHDREEHLAYLPTLETWIDVQPQPYVQYRSLGRRHAGDANWAQGPELGNR